MSLPKRRLSRACASVHPYDRRMSERYTAQDEELLKLFKRPGASRVTRWQDLVDALNANICSCVVRTEYGVAQKWRRMVKQGKIPQPCTLVNGHTEDVLDLGQPDTQSDSLQANSSIYDAVPSQPHFEEDSWPHSNPSHDGDMQEHQPEIISTGPTGGHYVYNATMSSNYSYVVPDYYGNFWLPYIQDDCQTTGLHELIPDWKAPSFDLDHNLSNFLQGEAEWCSANRETQGHKLDAIRQ